MKPRLDEDLCYFRLALIKSPIQGRGVIAKEAIPARRNVIEYTGRLMNRKQYATFHKTVKRRHEYIWEISPYWVVDGGIAGSGAQYINHSCDPNLRVKIAGKRVWYVSRRAIKKGEELTIDYRFDPDPKNPTKCACGAKACRGTINL